ncbi:MAG: hypothetical protein OXG35_25880, partial [Acidobacteria bacterium]|nr:hypothetical protein [Acidobacteriota bacterium]
LHVLLAQSTRRPVSAASIIARESLIPGCSGGPFSSGHGVPFHVAATTLRCHSALDRNIELKHALHRRFRHALANERDELVDYYVGTFGGINNVGEDARQRYSREHAATLADEGLINIASRSKALVLHDPSRYAIYDSRVAVSLNYLVIRRVGHGRGYIGRKDGRKCFPLPPTRAQGARAARDACRTLSRRYDIPFYSSTSSEFYKDYLRAIREAAEPVERLGTPGDLHALGREHAVRHGRAVRSRAACRVPILRAPLLHSRGRSEEGRAHRFAG